MAGVRSYQSTRYAHVKLRGHGQPGVRQSCKSGGRRPNREDEPMADGEKVLVPGVSIETLGECLRLEVAKAFGRPVEKFTSSAHKELYREMAREMLKRARLKTPVRIVRARVRRLASTACYDAIEWLEPSDGGPDLTLTAFGKDDELIELIQVEPER